MDPTYESLEAEAKRLKDIGMTLNLFKTEDGYAWQWNLKGIPGIFNQGSTTAQSKPIALAMALSAL